MWKRLLKGSFLPINDVGVDLGTANTLVYVAGEGIVLNEPSVVAVEKSTDRIMGIGLEAKRMLGRTPHGVEAVRPLKDGVIADVDITEIMLRYFLKHNSRSPRIVLLPLVMAGLWLRMRSLMRRVTVDGRNNPGTITS